MLCVSVMLVILLADLASHGQVQLYASQGMHSTFNYFSLFTNAPALATVQVAPTPCVALMASPVSPLPSVPFSSIWWPMPKRKRPSCGLHFICRPGRKPCDPWADGGVCKQPCHLHLVAIPIGNTCTSNGAGYCHALCGHPAVSCLHLGPSRSSPLLAPRLLMTTNIFFWQLTLRHHIYI